MTTKKSKNTYKNRHTSKKRNKTFEEYNYSLSTDSWMSVEQILNQFTKVKDQNKRR